MSGKKKSESAEVAARVEEVLRIRLDGAQFHDVADYARDRGWGVAERQLRTYIARADALILERMDRSRRQAIARHLAQRTALYARAVNAADYRTALAVLADEARLRGLYPDRDLKELARLAAAQGARIADLERRLADADPKGETAEAAGRAGGPAQGPGGDAAGGGDETPGSAVRAGG